MRPRLCLNVAAAGLRLPQVALEPVPYAANGSFSVNLWVKPGNMSGDGLGYLFSHRSTDANSTGTSGFGPNQVLPSRVLPSRACAAGGAAAAGSGDSPRSPGRRALRCHWGEGHSPAAGAGGAPALRA
jgi:hypothetical protein